MGFKMTLVAVQQEEPKTPEEWARLLGFPEDAEETATYHEIRRPHPVELGIANWNGFQLLVGLDLTHRLVAGELPPQLSKGRVVAGYTFFDVSGFAIYQDGELIRCYKDHDVEELWMPPFEGVNRGTPLDWESPGIDSEDAAFRNLEEVLGGIYGESVPDEFFCLPFRVFMKPTPTKCSECGQRVAAQRAKCVYCGASLRPA